MLEKILKRIVLGLAFIMIGSVILSIVCVIGFVIYKFFAGLFGW
ncbi:MAG TPA: hypothetical protein VK806_06465 [Bacteroidia bacterium]|nr:hypothetical protein [Bacteroidia bacterium]